MRRWKTELSERDIIDIEGELEDASELMTNSKKRIDCVNNTIIVNDMAVTIVAANNIFKTYLSKIDITLEWPDYRFILVLNHFHERG